MEPEGPLPESNGNRVSLPNLGQRAESNCILGGAGEFRNLTPLRATGSFQNYCLAFRLTAP